MSLRMPQNFSSSPRFETGLNVLETQMMAEQASSLGRLGSDAEKALAALNATSTAPGSDEHEALTNAAAKAVWYFFIQRDACGIRDHDTFIPHYKVPRAVLARLGTKV